MRPYLICFDIFPDILFASNQRQVGILTDLLMDAFAPSTTTWRRQRLTRITSNSTLQAGAPPDSESSNLQLPENGRSYGTMPARQSRRKLPPISLPQSALSSPSSPLRSPSVSVFRDLAYSRLSIQRPISAYDTPVTEDPSDDTEIDARINGVRVWYVFVSITRWFN
jgi:chloride channel 3/4/5